MVKTDGLDEPSRKTAPRLVLPSRGSLTESGPSDPLRYYYAPVLGRVFRARIDTGLALLAGPYQRLLEVGFGSGLLLPTLAGIAGRLDGIDLESDPDDVRARIRALGVTVGDLERGDVQALPFPDGVYDCVVAFSILEHLKAHELKRALGEVRRVMVPGGHFLVGCPAVHKAMNLGFAAIGFRGIEQHHFSSIRDVLALATPRFTVQKIATLPSVAPLGWAPYNAVLLRAGG